MGYTKKSEDEKSIQGTDRADRKQIESVEPSLLDKIPEPPEILGKGGKKYWKKYAKILHDKGMLAETDLDILSQYCMNLQIAEHAATKLSEDLVEDQVNKGGHEYKAKSKYLSIFNEATDRALKIGKEFGFTPLSRKNIPAPKQRKEGKLIKLMGGKG